MKNKTNFPAVCLVCVSLFISLGCASSTSDKFQSKIQRMSDNDLTNYYHGIDARLKEIDRDITQEQTQDPTQLERVISNRPYFYGGEGQNLFQKRKMILKELDDRNLSP
jgi:hypothetical protein